MRPPKIHPMAPPARTPLIHTSTQGLARSHGQDYTPGWLLARPVTIQNQRLDPLVHTPNLPEEGRAVKDYRHDQRRTRRCAPAPTPRSQSSQPIDALSVQERLYNINSASSSLSRAQSSLAALSDNNLDQSLTDAEMAVILQHELYTVDEPQAQGGLLTLSGEKMHPSRHHAPSRRQREAQEVEEHCSLGQGRGYNATRAELSSHQEALRRPSYATTFEHQYEQARAEPRRFPDEPRKPSYASISGHRQVYQPDSPIDRRRTRDTTSQSRHRLLGFHNSSQNIPEDFRTRSVSPNEDSERPLSKRASKAAKILEEHGQDTQLGADNRPKGLVQFGRFRNSRVQWRNSDGENWRPAVYHHELRHKYAVQQNLFDRFDVARAMGNDHYDVTTFLELWRHWRPSRKDGWQGVQADVLYRFERDEYPIPNYTPECLMDEGRIVLDLDNHPVKDWRELPLCLSSALEGSDIETVRRINPGITLLDIRARMPKSTLTGPKKDRFTPLFGLTALGNRTVRFRERNACPSWLERTGSDRLKDFVWSLMSQQQRNANSTQGLGMLTELQLAEFKEQTKGKFLERAGSRALPDEEREKRHAADADKLLRLREIAGSQEERSSRQRKRTYTVSLDTDDEDEVQFLGSKRRKTPLNTSSVEKQAEDELDAMFPSRESESNLGALHPSHPPPQHQYSPINSRNSNRRKRSQFSENDSDDSSFQPELERYRDDQPSYTLEDPFTGSAFGSYTYRSGISYPARSGLQSGPTTNSGRASPGFHHRSPTKFGNASNNSLASFPVGYNHIPGNVGGSSNHKRRHSNTRALDDEPSDPEPKRRGSIQRSRLPENSFASQDSGVSNRRPPFPRGRSRRYNSAARHQRPTLQRSTKPSPPSYAANPQQSSVRKIDHSLNHENLIMWDNADFPNNEASMASIARDNGRSLKEQLVSAALFHEDGQFFNYENLDSANAAHETSESENYSRLRTLSPSPEMENLFAVQSDSNGQQHQISRQNLSESDFHVAEDFQIREDTPETHQENSVARGNVSLENAMEDDHDGDKENQAPSTRTRSTPDVEITQTGLVPLDDVQLDNVVSGSGLEAALIRNFFDLEAAASGEPPSLDYRFVEPHSEIDERIINVALWFTLAEVSWWTEGAKVATTQRKSYQFQYEEIQATFTNL